MKSVFKCDYCEFMGTEEETREHELKCIDNYDRKSCYTCTHKQLVSQEKQWYYKCKLGKEIPVGKIFEFCTQYERKEKPEKIKNLFGNLFGF